MCAVSEQRNKGDIKRVSCYLITQLPEDLYVAVFISFNAVIIGSVALTQLLAPRLNTNYLHMCMEG